MTLDGFRVAARGLRKQPAFTTVVVLSLALGIALNTTMYGMLDALLHPRMAMRDAGRLYWIRLFGDAKFRVDMKTRDEAVTTGMKTYAGIARYAQQFGTEIIEYGAKNVAEGTTVNVSPNYFDVIGVRALAGRTFVPEDVSAETRVAVINEFLAGSLFPDGRSPIGEVIVVRRTPHKVIGVVPERSDFPHARTAIWTTSAAGNSPGMFTRIIRLRDGASAEDADRELTVIAGRIAAAAGEDPRYVAFRFKQAADPEFQVRNVHLALIAAVVAVLLVACTNLANLQLARGISRRRDLAVRSALGATRRRLVLHLLNESVLLAGGGLTLGLILTFWGSRLLAASIPKTVGSYIVEPQMSWRVLVFALVATAACLVIVGLAPSIRVSRTDPNDLLKSGAGTGATKRHRNQYAVLVGVQMALALALGSGAAVMIRTSMRMNMMAYGYDPTPLATGYAGFSSRGGVVRYSEAFSAVAARLRAVDGVADAGVSVSIGVENGALSLAGVGGVREFAAPQFGVTAVSAGYLRTLRMPIVAGRDFIEGERDEPAAIVDERTARLLWPNENPIGAMIKLGDKKSVRPYVRVVGVVGEQARFSSKAFEPFRGSSTLGRIFYLPGPADTLAHDVTILQLQFIARASGNPETLPLTLRRQAASRFIRVVSMDEYLGLTRQRQSNQFIAALFSLFAALGIALSAFGVYGIVAHAVAERRRELGVRVALGATSRDILHAVLRESTVVALAGVALGLLMTKYGVTLLRGIALEDELFNAPLFALVAAILVSAAVVSALVPALRATRIDPTESLRNE